MYSLAEGQQTITLICKLPMIFLKDVKSCIEIAIFILNFTQVIVSDVLHIAAELLYMVFPPSLPSKELPSSTSLHTHWSSEEIDASFILAICGIWSERKNGRDLWQSAGQDCCQDIDTSHTVDSHGNRPWDSSCSRCGCLLLHVLDVIVHDYLLPQTESSR